MPRRRKFASRAHLAKLTFLVEYAEDFALDPIYWLAEIRDIINDYNSEVFFSGVAICLPHQLDRTIREDLFDEAEWIRWHKTNPNNHKWPKYGQNKKQGVLSEYKDLSKDSIGWSAVYSVRSNPFGIIPEISQHGRRRCVFVSPTTGARCLHYAQQGVICREHMKHKRRLEREFRKYDMMEKLLKNSTLREMYEDFKNSDARSLEEEIALQRTMLGTLLSQIPEELDPSKFPLEIVQAVVEISDKVSRSVEKYDRIQHKLGLLITPEQVQLLMRRMLQIVDSVLRLEPDQLEVIADRMERELTVARPTGVSYNPETRNVDIAYGKEAPPTLVKRSNRCTRYTSSGEIKQVPPATEVRRKAEADRFLGFPTERKIKPEQCYLPHTEVDGKPVEIGDAEDPFFIQEDMDSV